LDDGVKLTQAGMAFGTPIYMAPEQALGNPMDGRADLYAAAVIAYEMLCGQPPFYSDDKLEVMSMHTARPVPPMRQRLVRGARPVPTSIERLVLRGLTKKPGDRYGSAEEFLAEVEYALRTPDGGVTDVVFGRGGGNTGSMPLVSADGEVQIAETSGFSQDATETIADAISEALSTPMPPVRALAAREAEAGADGGVLARSREATTAKGGVGLGLPYTGPQGQLVFGLTPEQRLSGSSTGFGAAKDSGVANALEPERAPTMMSRIRKRWWLYAVIGVCAIAIGVGGAMITARGERDGVEQLDPATPAGGANEALERGDPARALQILEANKEQIANDAKA